VKGDIENLDACLPRCSDQLTVSYDVDVDHAPAGQFDLVVDVFNNGERIHQFTIPLDSPHSTGHHELEFKSKVTETLPMVVTENCKLRVEGNIIPRNGVGLAHAETVNSAHGRSLDKKVRSIEFVKG
jgi:hypothetical protein